MDRKAKFIGPGAYDGIQAEAQQELGEQALQLSDNVVPIERAKNASGYDDMRPHMLDVSNIKKVRGRVLSVADHKLAIGAIGAAGAVAVLALKKYYRNPGHNQD